MGPNPISVVPQSLRLISPATPSPLLVSCHIKAHPEPVAMNFSWLKQTLSQRFNPSGISSFADVASKDPRLALPQLAVPDIRHLDWSELRRLGFQGVVFDKDNTLTAPYSLSLWPALGPAFELCRSVFPGKIAVFSNSAGEILFYFIVFCFFFVFLFYVFFVVPGLYQYDPDGTEARALEEAIGGIHVIRHGK